uniref:Peptidase S1 domain-containing protein n=1 Tax=Neogobius melanostomus TaxID=47308 RepID=A0A8C6V042_9GOBI
MPHSRKYMASLQFYGHHICGAHCTREMPVTVVLGAHNLTKKEPSQQRIQIKNMSSIQTIKISL